MNKTCHKFGKHADLFAAICGGLLMSLPVIPQAALAQQSNSKVNPCPKIFYEEPHNNQVLVPEGCPPNALTQRLQSQGLIPPRSLSTNPSSDDIRLGVGGETPGSALNPNPSIFNEPHYNPTQGSLQTPNQGDRNNTPRGSVMQPPLARQQQTPIATIAPTNGQVNIRLLNNTGANVTYQIIGDTGQRSLEGKSNVMLQGLSIPITLTFYREDGGLLAVTPITTSQPGMLEVTLRETTKVKQDTRAVRIEQNGQVYLN